MQNKIKPWQRFLVKELDMLQNKTDVMAAVAKTQARYSVPVEHIIVFLRALAAKAREQHAAGELNNG